MIRKMIMTTIDVNMATLSQLQTRCEMKVVVRENGIADRRRGRKSERIVARVTDERRKRRLCCLERRIVGRSEVYGSVA